MSTMLRRFAFAIAILGIAAAARPQERAASIAAASAEGGLRVIAPADVVRIRVQVLTPAGTTMFDSGWTEGNVLDWALRDPFGHAVPFGTYRFVTTSADVAGRVSTREGSLHLQPGETRIESEDLAVAAPDAVPSMIRLAHNGDAGLVVTTRGDLAFRFGDFLARKDVELMRLTAAGNLDVSGFVRAGRGILFSDGTILQSAAAANILHLPGYQPAVAVSGVGTTNRLTKWADTVGTLTDSVVTELNGKVGIGTSTPGTLLHVFGAPAQDVFSGLGPDPVLGPAMNYGYAGSSFGRGAGFFNVRPDGSATAPNPSLRFMTANQQRIIISNLGNVGINTGFTLATAPVEKLEVAGNLKLIGVGNHVIFPDLTTMSTAGATLGANAFTGNQSVTGTIHASGAIDSSTEYDLAGIRVLHNEGDFNLFVGASAGLSNLTGSRNVFVGDAAGASNTDGLTNVFVGWWAGKLNVTGQNNTYVGSEAGLNATGLNNSFFGNGAGYTTTSQSNNSFFGDEAGYLSTGNQNTFVGVQSGPNGTSPAIGSNNSVLGFQAGIALTSGNNNVLMGDNAGSTIKTGNSNTLVGSNTLSGVALTNAAAIGARASVTQDNSLVLGSISSVNGAAASTKVGIGTTAPFTELHIRKDALGALGPVLTLMNGLGNPGAGAAIDFDGYDTSANDPTVRLKSIDDGNSSSHFVVSTKAPGAPTNPLVERLRITDTGILAINQVPPDGTTKLDVNGLVRVRTLNAGSTALCLDANNILSGCVSSIRYKDSVAAFGGGLDEIRRLRPVTFRWKMDGKRDLGFVAEEVERVEPLLATYDTEGQVQGVKYDRVATLLVNAVNELADDRERLKQENDDLRARVERLEKVIEKLAPR